MSFSVVCEFWIALYISQFLGNVLDIFRRMSAGEALNSAVWGLRWQVRVSILLVCVLSAVNGQIRYSVPEEMRKGLFVGDVAKDLGLDVKRLISGRARLVIDGNSQYVELNQNKGHLVVKERIDREKLCGQKSPCSFSLEMILESPLELYSITIEIEDINDNAPVFSKKDIHLEIGESSPIGTVFLLDGAADPDVGMNSLQSYTVKPTDHFVLKQHSRADGSKYAEMVLQSGLDREKQSEHSLILTAADGGDPQRSGTVKIHITVLDANDNAPVFTESLYKVTVVENALGSTVVAQVSAIDADQGYNGNVTYSFTHMEDGTPPLFHIDPHTGEIKLTGHLDYETVQNYEMNLQAKDPWGLTGASKLVIEIVDINDNSPIITMTSFSGKIPEDSIPGTVVALISVQDVDAGRNGQVRLRVDENLPFKIKTSLRNYYTLVTEKSLDREKVSRYNITLTATDEGLPPLSSMKTVVLDISDVNDNAPAFSQSVYSTHVVENNSPGVSVLAIQATDPDRGQNSRISYYLIDSELNGNPISTYFSINSEKGVIHSVRSLDYEQVKEFKILIKAQDGGSPPLSSNTTVLIYVQDQNDNAPQVLYPVQTSSSLVAEMVPRSADVGYLVTKVVAVDVDSGQNAWLSYKLQKATDRALFEVGLQNGEIRTIRQVNDKDTVKQRLTVVVEDNGQPSRSATVNVNVAVADSFPEVLSEFTDFTHDKEYNDNLTFYLVLALAVVSFLFITCLVVIISVKIYRWRQSRILYHSNLPVIPYYPPRYADTLGTGTLQPVYNYEVCRTTDSRKSDCQFTRPCSQNVLIMDPSSTGTMQRMQSEQNILDEPDSPLEARYTIPEEQAEGSIVGNIGRDLGLEVKRLVSGKARIITRGTRQYVDLNRDKGIIVVKERIDREELCGQTTPCSFSFELIVENPIQLYPVRILVQDQNDNAPQVLYPVQTSSSLVAEMVPRSADVGYLVTKVVAVDVDSGQNAWLSYKLQKATDRALFEVGLQNGEIRTIRQVNDKDTVKQRLTVVVEDNGQPSRSATVNVNVAVADSFPEVLSEFTDFTHDKEYNDNLTLYLVLALAVVSFLFITCLVVIISVKIYRWRQSRILYHSNLPVIPYYPPRYADTLGTGTLQHVYNYEVCRTTDSRKSDCQFARPCSQNVLIMDPSSTGTMQRMQSEQNILDEPDSPIEVS
ncbi:protocadherin beta-16-like [Salmo trutta]|uniref:protocadherin beta-16-like n=1 Tax=Salmo trutta TaxID=8032 RepID=UPI0011326B88|nr:protocadherin beta-16-like [Salmo trutta]